MDADLMLNFPFSYWVGKISMNLKNHKMIIKIKNK